MKAVVLRKPQTLELMDIPLPALTSEHDVLIEVGACGICGSDLRYWAGENPWALHTLRQAIPNPPNIVLGHEFSGTVVRVNAARYEHLLGQRVAVQAYRSCGRCRMCRTGREFLCPNTAHIGHAHGWGERPFYPGAYAEYCLGWGDLVFPLADETSFAEAAMADILSVALHAVGRAPSARDASALCIGGGPAGLGIAQTLRARGCEHVMLSEPSPIARAVIETCGDFAVVDPRREDIPQSLQAFLGECVGCDLVFDSVGTQETLETALAVLAESGTYVNVAVHSTEVAFNALDMGSERVLTSSCNSSYRDIADAAALIDAGDVDVSPWITHRMPLADAAAAFDLLLRTPKQAYKVILTP